MVLGGAGRRHSIDEHSLGIPGGFRGKLTYRKQLILASYLELVVGMHIIG